MYRNLLGIGAVFLGALILVGITFSASVDRPADFTFINGTEPKTLDPHIMTGQPEGRIADAIFEGLMYRAPKSLLPVPGVAKAQPDISPDGTRYTFHLRENARWSDGRQITAHDFAWSWRRLQRPDLGAEYAYIQHMIKWAEIYNTYGASADAIEAKILPALEELRTENADGVDAKAWRVFVATNHVSEALKNVDDEVIREALGGGEPTMSSEQLRAVGEAMGAEARRRRELYVHAEAHYGVDAGVWASGDLTLEVELNSPTPYFLDVVAFYSSLPVPRHVVDVKGNEQDWFLPHKVVSNGPYRMTRWDVNQKIRIVKNETYWDAANTKMDVIDALPVENWTTALNLYLTGAADWLPSNYPEDLADQLKLRPDFYANPGMVVYYYRFNCTRPPLDDPRVRQALSMAIDRELICSEVKRLGQPPAYHLVPPGMASYGYEKPESKLKFDVKEAKRLLAEAGFPNGKGWPGDVGILFNTNEGHKKMAEVVADQIERHLAIKITPYNEEWQAYQSSTLKLNYWMARAGWIGDYLDPNTFMDMWITNGGNNQTGWGSPLYDRLVQIAGKIDLIKKDPETLIAQLKEQDVARSLLETYLDGPTQKARLEAGAKLRMHLFREAEAILFQDQFPICPIYYYVVSGLVRSHVKGFYWRLEFPDGSTEHNLQDIHPLRGLWIDKGAKR